MYSVYGRGGLEVTTGARGLPCGDIGECGETTDRGNAESGAVVGECSSEGDTIAGFIELVTE